MPGIRNIEVIKKEVEKKLSNNFFKLSKEQQKEILESYISEVFHNFITIKYGGNGLTKAKEEVHLLKELCDYYLDLNTSPDLAKFKNKNPINLNSTNANTCTELMELLVVSNRLGHLYQQDNSVGSDKFFDIKHHIECLILEKSNREELTENGISLYNLFDETKKKNKNVLVISQIGYPIYSIHFSRDLLIGDIYKNMYNDLPNYNTLLVETTPYGSPYKYTNNPNLIYNPKPKYALEQTILANSNNKFDFLKVLEKGADANDFQIYNTLSIMGIEPSKIAEIMKLFKSKKASPHYFKAEKIQLKEYQLSVENLNLDKFIEAFGFNSDPEKFMEEFKSIEDGIDKNKMYKMIYSFVFNNPEHKQCAKWKNVLKKINLRTFAHMFIQDSLAKEREGATRNLADIMADIGFTQEKNNLNFILNCDSKEYKNPKTKKVDEIIRDNILELVALKQSIDDSEETKYFHEFILSSENPIVKEKYQQALEKVNGSKKVEIENPDKSKTTINEAQLQTAATTNEFLDNLSSGVKVVKTIDEKEKKQESPDD